MAFSDDAVLSRLSSLNESHESIATASQWIMFHRRHADRTVQLWLQKLRDSSSTKRLSLVYLANEVTQQSKARNRPDFVLAFSPVVAEGLSVAYKGAPNEIQGKLRRVVEVWADRNIFEQPIQAAIETRLDEADKAKGVVASRGGFNSFSNNTSVPQEFANMVAAYHSIDKTNLPMKSSCATADKDWHKIQEASSPPPSAPVYAARLNGLMRSLAAAEGAVADSVKARRKLVGELESLLKLQSEALVVDEQRHATLSSRKAETEEKRREVELAIMKTLPTQDTGGASRDGNSRSPMPEPERPEVEELTPPPESAPAQDSQDVKTEPLNGRGERSQSLEAPPHSPLTEDGVATDEQQQPPSGIEMLSNLASQYHSIPVSTNGSNKRRRVDSNEVPDLGADDGIDADVAETLRRESNEAS